MAVSFTNSIVPSNTLAADFRAWCQFLHAGFVTTGGWTNTADTGQVDLTTVAAPGAANTKMGYKIYSMNDALQASSPVYLRVDFGSGTVAANPAVWLTIGTGSDGSGNITNKKFDGGSVVAPTTSVSSAATSLHNSYLSADSSRIQVGLFISTTTTRILLFTLERTKATDGTDNGDGIILYYVISGALTRHQYVYLGAGAQPPFESGVQYILPTANPTSFGLDLPIGVPIPIKGTAQPHGLGFVIVRTNDFIAESQFAVTLYGASRTYQHLNVMTVNNALGAADSNSRVCMRYD